MDRQPAQERAAQTTNGFNYILVGLASIFTAAFLMWIRPAPSTLLIAFLCLLLVIWSWGGLYMLQPNQAAVMTFFGSYRGTDRNDGLRWANPFYAKARLSVRARNFNSEKLKVNDLRGNPIEIAAAVVWNVQDTARASFDVEDFEAYVFTQAEAAVRHLASSYAYDNMDDNSPAVHRETTLRSGTEEVSMALRAELQERFAQAGVVVVDAKLTHLAYAPEIAGTMLRRQQAEAVVAARSKIVLGAVSMVELALKGLTERGLVDLDDERKAAMVSNLLVVLCADRDATPVVNTGTLYN
ncbi:SPFH domain-containing protein [Piscinibacter terrae]|uniref:SPFH domain-containing protein n=1 Tax=Piscinibacter terrae TaxID=2496871 RepID=A0A3N7HS46_9BURK|nr:SPFH domain-containing protein [Albitalea terrae]RQP25014.1 SPFH domain-containing protein [Albitalea terrae]